MGCNYSKPWKNSKDIVGAYQWDERDCGCGSNTFKLIQEPESIPGTITSPFEAVKDIIDPKLDEAAEYAISNRTRSCICASRSFEAVVESINVELAPDINSKLEPLGYKMDAFMWDEWHYNGTSSQQIFYLVLRIRDIGVLESSATTTPKEE